MERRIRLGLIGIFLVLGACQSNSKLEGPNLKCQPEFYYSCEGEKCQKEEISSVYIELNKARAEVGMFSVITKDSSPRILSRQGTKYFIIHAQGKSVNGESVKIHAFGEISKDQKFKALIDGVQYEGKCQ